MIFVVAHRPGITYNDNFNRSNGALGANWVTIGSHGPVVSSNRAQAGTSGPSNAGTVYVARYTSPVFGDGQKADCNVVTPTGTSALGLGGGVMVRANTSGDRVEALVTSNSAHIFTRIGGTATERAVQTGLSVSSGTALRLTAIGNLYSLYLAGSGTPTTTWTDSGGVIDIDSSTRYVGIVCIAQKDIGGNSSYGYAIDDWAGADL